MGLAAAACHCKGYCCNSCCTCKSFVSDASFQGSDKVSLFLLRTYAIDVNSLDPVFGVVPDCGTFRRYVELCQIDDLLYIMRRTGVQAEIVAHLFDRANVVHFEGDPISLNGSFM